MSFFLRLKLRTFLIQLEEIKQATKNFSPDNMIAEGPCGVLYEGQLSERWQNCKVAVRCLNRDSNITKEEILHAIRLFSSIVHENIIRLIGYCDEGNTIFIVYEYASNGSLNDYLQNPRKRRRLTWSQRLKICLGAATGIHYLHTGLQRDKRVIHRNIKSSNILLDDNLDAKIGDTGLSRYNPAFKEPSGNSTVMANNLLYMDPIYYETGFTKESDVYSFGLVLFEMLSGILVSNEGSFGYGGTKNLRNLVRLYKDRLDKLIDPCISAQIDNHSFSIFKELANKCIQYDREKRPTIEMVIEGIKEALYFQDHSAAHAFSKLSHQQYANLERFLIPLEEIKLATRNFSPRSLIGDGEFSELYKGKLSERWKNCTAAIKRFSHNGNKAEKEFYNELYMMISSFNHENIIPFIGFCDEENEMIIVYEYATNGSLDNYLQDPWKSHHITWAQRLKICAGAARALNYLHSGLWGDCRIIHGDVNSSNILLDDNMEAKICGFGSAIFVNKNQTRVYTNIACNRSYIDPVQNESGILSTESDVYSFGIVLFEMLSGMLHFHVKRIRNDEPGHLINLARRYYDDGPEKLIDPHIKYYIDRRSFQKVLEIAYKCISLNLKDRPTIDRIIKRIEESLDLQNQGDSSTITIRSHHDQNLEKYMIPLEDIKLAIGVKCRETCIGDGGFGVVYRGKLSERWQKRTAAIKHHNPKSYQGKEEFRNELEMMSRFHHENIIPFIGYCDEGNEMIIVSEYATNGSLDQYLNDLKKRRSLSWVQRLKICLGAAKGLNYLHSGLGDDNRVVHRDVKSANILLDDNLVAKICDFGLSRSGPRNQPDTQLYTKAAGTNFYMDPIYRESAILRKESDVYSFGVVLFEILSGMLAYQRRPFGDNKPQPLISLVRRYHDEGLDMLIDPYIKDQIDKRSFATFKRIAHECISYNLDERPTMEIVIERLEVALEYQVILYILNRLEVALD